MNKVAIAIFNVLINYLIYELLKDQLSRQEFRDWGVYIFIAYFFFSWFIMLGFLIKTDAKESGVKLGLTLLKNWLSLMISMAVIGFIITFVFF